MLKQNISKHFTTKLLKINKITTDGNSIFGTLYTNHKRHNPIVPLLRLNSINDTNTKKISRKSAFDYINDFVKNVIPKVETFVESRLLEKFKLGLSSKEKLLVDDAYLQRKVLSKPKDEILVEEELKEVEEKPYVNEEMYNYMNNSIDGKGLSYHTYNEIGILYTFLLILLYR